MRPVIETRNLNFGYTKAKNVFENISFDLRSGQLCALMGGNGSGKTTLIRCLMATLRPDSGRVILRGRDITCLSRAGVARMISSVPQEHSSIFPYTVLSMVLMGRAPHLRTLAGPSKADTLLAQEALAMLGIEDLAARPYTCISGGQRQLVLIARALVQDTPVMILDEPTSHLDYRNQILILGMLKKLVRQKGILVIIATHDPNHALYFADTTIVLHAGSILQTGPPRKVINKEMIREVYAVEVEEIRRDNTICGVIPVHIEEMSA